jgi:HlyD family secretion protein
MITRKIKFIIIIIAILILGIVGWVIFGGGDKTSYDFAIVKRGNVVEEVSATGTVKSAEDINLRFEIGGTVEKIYVSEGSQVKQGAQLVKLDTGKLYSQFLQAQAGYNEAKAKLDKLLAGATTEEIQVAERVVENARVVLEDVKAKAENDLNEDYDNAVDIFDNAYFDADKAMKKLKTLFSVDSLYKEYRSDLSFRSIQVKVETKNKKEEADSAFENLKALVTAIRNNSSHDNVDNSFDAFLSYLRTIRDALDSAGNLIDLVILHSEYSQTQWDADKDNIESGRTTINSAVSDVLSAQQALATQKVANQTNINSAENTLKKAEDDLAKIKAVPREVDIAVYKSDVDKTKASMVELQQKLNDAALKAPIDAVITKVNVKIGETVTAGGDTVVSLIGLSRFEIKVDVPESDIGKIGAGNDSTIILDAFPGEIYLGNVAEIEPAETLIEGVVYYRVTVVFDKVDERIKSGMSADLTIETNKKENVLFIPYRAIVFKDGKKIVRVSEGKDVREVEVEIGLRGSEGEVEIVSGLNEGDKVVVFIKSR